MKQRLLALVAVCAMLACLAGCGAPEQSQSGGQADAGAAAADAPTMTLGE